MLSLGKTIRTARKEAGLTMNELAEKTDLTQGYVSKIENDLKIPTQEVLQKISTTLKTPFNELMAKAGYIKTFGQSVREFREEKSWTLEELEKKTINSEYGEPIFINKEKLYQIENGDYNNPSIYEIYLLSYALGVPPWSFSTFELKTPNTDLIEFLNTPNKPDPIKLMNNVLNTMKTRLNEEETTSNEKTEILSQIHAVEDNKKRYIDQLNKLSLNNKPVIEELYSEPESEEERLEKLKVMLLSESPTYMNGVELSNKQKEMILLALDGNFELINEHMTLDKAESEKD
ncbi:helix-turn-helix domain-containing protein [Lysinibacillus agricola]|uniref:helix-turn-helix domain-containing protein n=1 Tax=Lysinibacillus agricola TaxID=2590012 RepID=UPI003C27B89B